MELTVLTKWRNQEPYQSKKQNSCSIKVALLDIQHLIEWKENVKPLGHLKDSVVAIKQKETHTHTQTLPLLLFDLSCLQLKVVNLLDASCRP